MHPQELQHWRGVPGSERRGGEGAGLRQACAVVQRVAVIVSPLWPVCQCLINPSPSIPYSVSTEENECTCPKRGSRVLALALLTVAPARQEELSRNKGERAAGTCSRLAGESHAQKSETRGGAPRTVSSEWSSRTGRTHRGHRNQKSCCLKVWKGGCEGTF